MLPQILVFGDNIIEHTSFELNRINLSSKSYSGLIRVQGHLRGHVDGVLEGSFYGIIRGDMDAVITSGKAVSLEDHNKDTLTEGSDFDEQTS